MENRRKCNHPMFVMVGKKDACDKGIYNEARCILCENELKKEDRVEKTEYLETLYKDKKLLAKYKGIGPTDNLPMFDYIDTYVEGLNWPVEGMRKVYLEYCDEVQELIETGYLPMNFSFEESFFDSICGKDYKQYLYDKDSLEKEKVKIK